MQQLKLIILIFAFVFNIKSIGQNKTKPPKEKMKADTIELITFQGPKSITRNVIQDKNGDIWLATWEGIFRYDGKLFTNITSNVSKSRFFSILEDRKGNMWFGSIGSGAYSYDGKSFKNFTTKDGLPSNDIVCIYEDKIGNIWFGANKGASRYDGKTFRNYIMSGDSLISNGFGIFPQSYDRPPNEVNSIIEDKKGNFWFGTRGKASISDAKAISVVTNNGLPFTNVRCIIEDRNGHIWLGGNNGLWRYNGHIFMQISKNFTGYIFEDSKGNIWTSSQTVSDKGWTDNWALSRYDPILIKNPIIQPTVTEIKAKVGMIFGIMEAKDGSIWYGTHQGVHSWDGKKITDY